MTTMEVRETYKMCVGGEFVRSAGWAGRYTAPLSSFNPVASSYFDSSLPEPVGVVGVVCPESPALLGVVTRVLPVIATGISTIVLLTEHDPLPALEWAETLATSDLPAGVVNLLSGRNDELVPHLARHLGVNALALAGLPTETMKDTVVNVSRTPSRRRRLLRRRRPGPRPHPQVRRDQDDLAFGGVVSADSDRAARPR